jgi:phosphoribosylanthranilate isomerase
MFRIKICGVTSVADALAAAEAGADAIGLNFYAGSKRCVPRDEAARIVRAVGERAICIGVFVNEPAEEIRDTCRHAGLRTVQLHGDEPPELLAELNEFRLVRALRLAASRGAEAAASIDALCRAGRVPEMLLIDADCGGQYGGMGITTDWPAVEDVRHRLAGRLPVALAGGLTPANVAEAIAQARPDAVDVASGVETAPGRKDAERMRAFVEAARGAFARIVTRDG